MDTMTASAVATVAEEAETLPATAAADYWHRLIDEASAADFLNMKVRTMQNWRAVGGGPQYVRVSSRCIRYRRCDLREWADARLRKSTADTGKAA